MNLHFSKIYKLSIILLFWSMPFIGAKAYYFSYVPDITSKFLYVFNTSLYIPVKNIKLVGSPRNVQVSNSGKYVFVSTVVTDGAISKSYLNIVNTSRNEVESYFPLPGDNVRGVVISQDDRKLFLTHEAGVTMIEDPGTLNTVNNLGLTYSGMNLVVSNDNKYLFVIGTNGIEDGISVVELNTFTEISNISLGANKGANEIVFDINNLKLFVANSNVDQVVAININNYAAAASLSLEDLGEERSFNIGARPVDLTLHNNGSELLVVLSYIKNDQSAGTGNGNIVILKTNDISATNNDAVSEIFFDSENSTGGSGDGGAIHPLAVNIDDKGFIYVLKQLWSNETGIYVVKMKDSTNISSNERSIKKVNSYNLGNKVSTLANGQFMGPDCETCPTGIDDIFGPTERPAAINPLFSFLMIFVIFLFRRPKSS